MEASTIPSIISSLAHARWWAKQRYLNTGEAYTLALIFAVQAERGRVTRLDIYNLSPLSRGTVDTHIRSMNKQGVVYRDGESLVARIP